MKWLVAVAVIVVGLIAYDTWRGKRDEAWHRDAEVQIAQGREALRENDELVAKIARDSARHEAALDSARAAKSESDRLAESAQRQNAILRARIAALDTVPLDPRWRAVIETQQTVIDSLNIALTISDAAYATAARVVSELRTENRALMALNDRLAARLDSTLTVLESRPKERPWWLPEVTAGLTGCWCDGKAGIGPGATIGYSVRF